MQPFSTALERIFSALAALHGVQLRYKDVDDHLRRAMPRHLVEHRHPRCMAIKGQSAAHVSRCVRRCGVEGLRWQSGRRPQRIVSCHGGCQDLRFPIEVDGRCIGSVSIGPFRRGKEPADLPAEPPGLIFVEQLLCEILPRLAGERDLERGRLQQQSLHPALQRFLDILQDSDHEDRVEDLANRCDVSLSRLQHLAREQCGASLRMLRDRSLLQRAQSALRDPQRAIGRVAGELGFRDQRYFATWFKRLCKLTPGDWRREQAERDDA